MLSPALQALARFEWCHAEVKARPDTSLLANVYWWECRDEVPDRIKAMEITISLDIPAPERYFCFAYTAMSVGDVLLYNQYFEKLYASQSDGILTKWLEIETLGRGCKYIEQARIVEQLLVTFIELPDWIATACFASLNHNGVNAEPLLTVLTRKPITTALGALLISRLMAAMGKPEKAMMILDQAYEKWPSCAAIPWFQGLLAGQLDQFTKSIKLAWIAESMGLVDMAVLRFLLGSLSSAPYSEANEEIFAAYQRAIHYVEGDIRHSGEMASYLIIRYWIKGDLLAAYQLLQKYHTFQNMEERTEDRHAQVFMRYAVMLCVAWQHNRHLYSFSTPLPPLFVLGESHSLTSSNLIFTWLGENRKSITCFIMGSKMWHFATPNPNRHKELLQNHLNSIPEGEPILFTIGEIDCRPDEGIWKTHKKTGRKLQGIIEKTTKGYLNYIQQICGNKKFASITISGVPAPAYSLSGKRDVDDKSIFLSMIREVNAQLKVGALERGLSFLDVYAATANSEGISNGNWHLDGWHLQPIFYVEAEKWLIKP